MNTTSCLSQSRTAPKEKSQTVLRIFVFLLLLFAAFEVFSPAARADGTEETASAYQFDPATGTLTILSENAFRDLTYLPLLPQVTSLILSSGIRTVPTGSFLFPSSGDSPLLSVITLPATLRTVESGAFSGIPEACEVRCYGSEDSVTSMLLGNPAFSGAVFRYAVTVEIVFSDGTGGNFLNKEPQRCSGFTGEPISFSFPETDFSLYKVRWSTKETSDSYESGMTFVFPSESATLIFTAATFRMLAVTRSPGASLTEPPSETEAYSLLSEQVPYSDGNGIPQRIGYTSYLWNRDEALFEESLTVPRTAFPLDADSDRTLYVLYIPNTYLLTVTYQYPNGKPRTENGEILKDVYPFTYGQEMTFIPDVAQNYSVDPDLIQAGFTYDEASGTILFDGLLNDDSRLVIYYEAGDTRFFYICLFASAGILFWSGLFLTVSFRSRKRPSIEDNLNSSDGS